MLVRGETKTCPVGDLPDDVEALKALLADRDARIAKLDQRVEAQQAIILKLRRIIFGRRSEKRAREEEAKIPAGQGSLFLAELLAEAERTAEEKKAQGEMSFGSEPGEKAKPAAKRKRKGRRSTFPAHLPRVTTHYQLGEDGCSCEKCGGKLHEIGAENSKELERIETFVVHEIRRSKYACRGCGELVCTAPGPDRVIEKGILGPGALAHTAVERFGNHMPYYRLERKYASEGVSLSRSVLERSMSTLAEILSPIRDRLLVEILEKPALFTDDTPVTIARPAEGAGSKTGRVWIYLDREGRHVYDFTESRRRDGPMRILGGYTGYIHADAYPGYNQLFTPEGAREVACWAHVRRKFEGAEASDPKLAGEALDRIAELYCVERAATEQNLEVEGRLELRQRYSAAIAKELFAWMRLAEQGVVAKGPMGMAFRYALTLEEALLRYLEDGYLSIDNNPAERALRSVAVGRKNWLFFQREGGGRTAAVLLSLVASAKAIDVDPRIYLRDVMTRIARESDVAKLTPHGWKRHFQEQVQAEIHRAMADLVGA